MNETKWYNLDNVAFYYASIKTKKRQTVFRFSCELKDNIDKDYLQIALKSKLFFFVCPRNADVGSSITEIRATFSLVITISHP